MRQLVRVLDPVLASSSIALATRSRKGPSGRPAKCFAIWRHDAASSSKDMILRIDSLRTRKTAMSADAYDDALENLLVQLARKAKSIREIEGRKS